MTIKKAALLFVILFCIVSALVLKLFPATALYNKILGKPPLNGFQSSFELSNYPMKNQFNQEVTWAQYTDKPLYITTGFTICSYTCPISMVFYKQLKETMNDSVSFSLLTIDPVNDTPQALKRFLEPFDPNFIGLQIDNQKNFRKALSELNQSISDLPGPQDIIHSNYIYLLHPKLDGLVVYTEQNLDMILKDYHFLTNNEEYL